ncbi:RidA family protein [Elongatibacter sediminis]|uniref:RidA family protein n=1 Tax=Elongatibacter sediminis TaxID=3119006 RepID=A0AAW9RD59_9GAMM
MQNIFSRTTGTTTLPTARWTRGLLLAAVLLITYPAGTVGADGTGSAGSAEARIKELGIQLPEVPPPVANYVNAVRTGNLVFLAGKGPNKPGGGYVTGKLGVDLTVEQGYEAARLTGIVQLAALRAELGSLDRVTRIVKVTGMVNASPDFSDQPEVINGFSDLMVDVFGERGKHARAAVGMGSLPRNIAVEIEMIVEVAD